MTSRVVCVGTFDQRLLERLAFLHPLTRAVSPSAALATMEQGGVELLLVAAGLPEGRRLIADVRRRWPELAVLFVGGREESEALRNHSARPPRVDGASLLELLPVLLAFPPTLLSAEIEKVVRLGQCIAARPPWKYPEEAASLLAGFLPAAAWAFLRLERPQSRLQTLIVDALPEESIHQLRARVLRVNADPQYDEPIACEQWGAPLVDMQERRALRFLAEPLECEGEPLGAIALCGREDAVGSPLQAHMLKLLAGVFVRSCWLPPGEQDEEGSLRSLCRALGDVSQPSDALVQLCRLLHRRPMRVEHCGFAVWLAGRELCASFPSTASLADSMAFNDTLVERFRELFALESSGAEAPNDAPQDREGLSLFPLWVGGRFLGVLGVRGQQQPGDFDLPTAVDMTCLALEGLLLKQTLETRDAERRNLSKLKHEINNALTVIIGNTQLMLFRASGDEAEMLRHMEECAVRIRDVATRLGELSRS